MPPHLEVPSDRGPAGVAAEFHVDRADGPGSRSHHRTCHAATRSAPPVVVTVAGE